MSASDCDVLIVGGGPAGLSTWLHLHALAPQLAARTVLIEKAVYPRDKPCAGAVTPLGVLLLEGLGISIDVPCVSVHTIEYHLGERAVRSQRPNALRVVRRAEFDHALAQAAVARGLTLHEGETFQTFRRDRRHVIIHTSRGEYRARVLVGADGVSSRVRRAMGLTSDAPMARALRAVTPGDVSEREFAANTAVFDFTPVLAGVQGYIWRFPCLENGSAAIDSGIYDSGMSADRVRRDLKAVNRELQARHTTVRATSWSGHAGRRFTAAGVFSQPNVVLAGEAAGIDPALGEGISPSLDYGDLVANTLIAAFRENDFSMADFKARLLGHPVGQSLAAREQLANGIYAGGAGGLRRLTAVIAGWLA